MAVINRIAGFADEMAGWRQHIHANPELGLECYQTAAFVVEQLRAFGVDEIHEGIATSGVVAVIKGQGDGPVTGLRADMDALPMQEATGVPYASMHDGRMHACGHDGHTAMLLGAAKYLAETRNFSGRVVLLFQPAEEVIGGGRIMVEEGVMDRFGIEEVYGLHTNPHMAEGDFETSEGPLMAAVDDFYIRLRGKGGHAAYPEDCIDPIPAASALVGALQTIVSRNVSTHDNAVLTVTQIHAGTAINIVPEQAFICGTMRTLTEEVRALTESRLRALVEGHAQAYGMELELQVDRGYPPTVNHPAQARLAASIAREVGGDVRDNVRAEMGAEDFSYMLEARPGAYLFIGQGDGPGVHHPKFDFNDEIAPIGASFFARLIETRHGRAR
ncbi:M20 aminoacylase family protein [Primorskyibacter sp. S187A]|uniref:M20 aminoacylase family protein n=1 Tax=Primorskyibacter sp. S187A TaxID=3415130 RepID=UPI003C7D7523